jgi:hypothetical protein
MDSRRYADLEYILRRINSVTAVFDVRCQTVADPKYRRFVDLMNIYVDCAQKALGERRDFVDDGLAIDEATKEQVRTIIDEMFAGSPPEQTGQRQSQPQASQKQPQQKSKYAR